MADVRVLGAGPAGCAAALRVLALGGSVEIFEKSPFPRHKVCGEFLSPEVAAILDRLDVWQAIQVLQPAIIRHFSLNFRGQEKRGKLPWPAYGLSRYALDQSLAATIQARGGVLRREPGEPLGPTVVATGRKSKSVRGNRLFGFKAHFRGPSNDVVELYFLGRHSYVGVNPVEAGLTNVCGLAEESSLAGFSFDIDALLHRHEPLRRRLAPLQRQWAWLRAGPLIFEDRMRETHDTLYHAGDSLSFVDPFTGSGILSALLTGQLAGECAFRRESGANYGTKCRKVLSRQRAVSALFRYAIGAGWAPWAATLVPSPWLFRLTRPRL
jgi:hypothetical protein